jgi:hypothetical protein
VTHSVKVNVTARGAPEMIRGFFGEHLPDGKDVSPEARFGVVSMVVGKGEKIVFTYERTDTDGESVLQFSFGTDGDFPSPWMTHLLWSNPGVDIDASYEDAVGGVSGTVRRLERPRLNSKYQLEDAAKIRARIPSLPYRNPSEQEKAGIRPGMGVYLGVKTPEQPQNSVLASVFVRTVRADGSFYGSVLDEEEMLLKYLKGVEFGDGVEFERRHVIGIENQSTLGPLPKEKRKPKQEPKRKPKQFGKNKRR